MVDTENDRLYTHSSFDWWYVVGQSEQLLIENIAYFAFVLTALHGSRRIKDTESSSTSGCNGDIDCKHTMEHQTFKGQQPIQATWSPQKSTAQASTTNNQFPFWEPQ